VSRIRFKTPARLLIDILVGLHLDSGISSLLNLVIF